MVCMERQRLGHKVRGDIDVVLQDGNERAAREYEAGVECVGDPEPGVRVGLWL